METLLGVTDDDKEKLALIKLYDFMKGGTQIVDQKNSRWPNIAFVYLLDTSRENARKINALNSQHVNRIN